MSHKLYLFIGTIISLSCIHTESSKIIIIGKVKNIPTKKLYLANAYQWENFLDSAEYINDEFKFDYKSQNIFEPFIASICYVNKDNEIKKLYFLNHILSAKKKSYGYDAFILEKGKTIIKGDLQSDIKLSVSAGKETDLLYKNQFNDWGYINVTDSLRRIEKIEQTKQTIKENPESYYLLNCILKNNASYTKKELINFFQLFNNVLQKSETGALLNKYINIFIGVKLRLNDILLTDKTNKTEKVIDTSKKLNVIIFWGSWCGPCRQEIPQLKQLYISFSPRDIRMVSIAVNDIKGNWLKALEMEKMKWVQLYADNKESEELKISFNIPSVPLIIITNRTGKELCRKTGFSNNNIEMHNLLDSLLKEQ